MAQAIILIAVLVRAYGIWAFPFEQDELYTIDEATQLFHTKLLPGIQARPVFFLMEHPIMVSLPHTPVVLRAIPFIFGILGVWITWMLAKGFLGARAGAIAALMVAISPWHVYASGFGRYYSFLYVLAALVYWLFPKAVDTGEPKYYLGTFVALLLGAWTHPSFVFPVAATILAVMLVGQDGRIRWSCFTGRRRGSSSPDPCIVCSFRSFLGRFTSSTIRQNSSERGRSRPG